MLDLDTLLSSLMDSSHVNNSCISLTVHYVVDQWNTCYHLQETTECSADHTAANLATGLEEALEC